MLGIARSALGGIVYHVINRATRRLRHCKKREDFQEFYRVLLKTHERLPMPVLGWGDPLDAAGKSPA
jgi:hypothetical protein